MDKPLILNEDAFAEIFTPRKVWHRDEQISELKRRLGPVLENRSVENGANGSKVKFDF